MALFFQQKENVVVEREGVVQFAATPGLQRKQGLGGVGSVQKKAIVLGVQTPRKALGDITNSQAKTPKSAAPKHGSAKFEIPVMQDLEDDYDDIEFCPTFTPLPFEPAEDLRIDTDAVLRMIEGFPFPSLPSENFNDDISGDGLPEIPFDDNEIVF